MRQINRAAIMLLTAHGSIGAQAFLERTSMNYLMLIIVTFVLGLGTQWYINHAYKKYSQVDSATGLTGAQVARRMLDDNGLTHVQVNCVAGTLTDHYDPRTRVVSLSEDIYHSTSVSAAAVACHECGHAVQHATGYVPMNIRSALVPLANFGSSAWLILLMIGIFFQMTGLILLACFVYGFAVLFQIVTLPVEFNASRRGLAYANNTLDVAGNGAKTVLTAAALTYVAAALTSIMQLLYYLSVFTDNR